MPPRRTRPLPEGVYERRHRSGRVTLWISFRDASGRRVREPAGSTIDGAIALRRRRQLETSGGLRTLRAYSETWTAKRRGEGVRTVDREAQLLRDHVLPHVGDVVLDELRPRDVARLLRTLHDAGELSGKSIRNAHGVLSAMLERARFDELVVANVAKSLPRGVLPPNVRKRQVAAWTRDECEQLFSDERIDEPRRVLYALAAFTGARLGELAGLRWRDIDFDAKPLPRWALRTQWDGAPLKTEKPRDVPVHAELTRMLAAWKLEGWPRFVLRRPTPADLVVPREDGSMHSENSAGAKAVHRHAAKIGLDVTGRDFHSFRRAFVTIARTDGAPADVVERITHNARGEQIDAYTYFGWEALCDAVARVRMARRAGRVVGRIAAGRGGPVTHAGTQVSIASISQLERVEAAGVEPPAGIVTARTHAEQVDGARRRASTSDTSNPGTSADVASPVTRVPRLEALVDELVERFAVDEVPAELRERLARWLRG